LSEKPGKEELKTNKKEEKLAKIPIHLYKTRTVAEHMNIKLKSS